MPTNLPPEYFEVDRRYRAATTLADRISLLEELIGKVPKHKGTDHLRADLRKKLSELRAEAHTKKGASRREPVFRIEREGAGQVLVIGPTNVGKSALVASLTNAKPEVANRPYTTWAPTPGMMPIDDIQVQLIDTPPLEREYLDAEFLDLIRHTDVILLVVDVETEPDRQMQAAVALLLENGISLQHPAQSEGEELRVGAKSLLVLANKTDDDADHELYELFCALCEHDWFCLPVSAVSGRNLERLKQAVFEALNIIRVYAKPPGRPPDLTSPFVLKKGCTVQDLARKVHRDFVEKLGSARVWGSAEFAGQMVQRDYVLHDRDVVELRI